MNKASRLILARQLIYCAKMVLDAGHLKKNKSMNKIDKIALKITREYIAVSNEQYQKRFQEKFPNLQFISVCKKGNDKYKKSINFFCPIHNEQCIRRCQELFKPNCKFGCVKCQDDSRKTKKEQFIQRCNKTHDPGHYSYEKIPDLLDLQQKVTITCRYHGDFQQRAQDHLNGANCKKCYEQGKQSGLIG